MYAIQNCDNCGKLAITGTMPKHENKQFCGDCIAESMNKDPIKTCYRLSVKYIIASHPKFQRKLAEEEREYKRAQEEIRRQQHAMEN